MALCDAVQSTFAVGVYNLRRSCSGYQSGQSCGVAGCRVCIALGVHRDLQSLHALSEMSLNNDSKYLFLKKHILYAILKDS